jgi:hypothetical protein
MCADLAKTTRLASNLEGSKISFGNSGGAPKERMRGLHELAPIGKAPGFVKTPRHEDIARIV